MGTPTIGTVDSLQAFVAVSSDPKTVTMVVGRAYVALLRQNGGGTRSYSFSDSAGNTWGNQVSTSASWMNTAAMTVCATGGSVTVTMSVTGGTSSGDWQIVEVVPNSGTLSFDSSSSFEDVGTATNHQMAASSGFSPSADSAIIGIGGNVATTSLGTVTEGASYTKQSGASTVICSQTRTTASLLTDHTAPWTSSNARQCKNVVLSVKETGGGGGGSSNAGQLLLLGCGA